MRDKKVLYTNSILKYHQEIHYFCMKLNGKIMDFFLLHLILDIILFYYKIYDIKNMLILHNLCKRL